MSAELWSKTLPVGIISDDDVLDVCQIFKGEYKPDSINCFVEESILNMDLFPEPTIEALEYIVNDEIEMQTFYDEGIEEPKVQRTIKTLKKLLTEGSPRIVMIKSSGFSL